MLIRRIKLAEMGRSRRMEARKRKESAGSWTDFPSNVTAVPVLGEWHSAGVCSPATYGRGRRGKWGG